MRILDGLAELPVLVAPMAGGPTTPALVAAAAKVGSLGFIAGGYRTSDDLAAQVEVTRAQTENFGVNLFVPNSTPIAQMAYRDYRSQLLPIAEHYGVELPSEPRDSDDAWQDKIDLLIAVAPPVVSFTFGIPEKPAIDALHRAGSALAQTVTSAMEAERAVAVGMDILIVQGSGAGGHSGTFSPDAPRAEQPLPDLVREVAAHTSCPIIAGGGIGSARDVAVTLHAGARAVAVGTALLLTPEAGTSATHRRALLEWRDRPTTITHAFTGRPARGIHNSFIDAHQDAPFGYPVLHYLTQPIRRAAAVAGEPENVHLWAGTGFAQATEQPAGEALRALSGT